MRDGPFAEGALSCGLRVVCEHLPHAETVALGLWLQAGPVYESQATSGLSHFLEHCLFKGAGGRDTKQLALDADELGGELDGVTEREATVLDLRVVPEDLERGAHLLCDLAFRPMLPPEEVEREKQVVLQEKAMAHDRPGDVLADLLLAGVWPGHPLGSPILGNGDAVSDCDAGGLGGFHRETYAPALALMSAAGALDFEGLAAVLEKYVPAEWPEAGAPRSSSVPAFTVGEWKEERDFEQVHLCLAVECPAAAAPERYALALLDAVLGGSVSSRLFQAVREERGLAYSVGSSISLFRQTGIGLIHLSTAPDLAEEALRVVADEVKRLRERGVEEAELARAKQQAKAGLVLSMDTTTARMGRLAKNVLLLDRILPMDEALERLEQVRTDDVSALAAGLLGEGRLALAAVGPLGEGMWDNLRSVWSGL